MTDIQPCENPDCPKRWEKLAPSGESHIRICSECLKAVYLCESKEEAEQRHAAGQLSVVES